MTTRDAERDDTRILPRPTGTHIWALAVLLFGVGDVATTVYFIEIGVATEANPVGAAVLDYGYAALAVWKAVVVGVFYLFYRVSPRSIRVGIPIGLVLLGGFITAWNTYSSLSGTAIPV